MGATDQVHVVLLEEARHNIGAECEADTSVVFTPPGDVLVRIGPQQIAQQTAVGDLEKMWGQQSSPVATGWSTRSAFKEPGTGTRWTGHLRRWGA